MCITFFFAGINVNKWSNFQLVFIGNQSTHRWNSTARLALSIHVRFVFSYAKLYLVLRAHNLVETRFQTAQLQHWQSLHWAISRTGLLAPFLAMHGQMLCAYGGKMKEEIAKKNICRKFVHCSKSARIFRDAGQAVWAGLRAVELFFKGKGSDQKMKQARGLGGEDGEHESRWKLWADRRGGKGAIDAWLRGVLGFCRQLGRGKNKLQSASFCRSGCVLCACGPGPGKFSRRRQESWSQWMWIGNLRRCSCNGIAWLRRGESSGSTGGAWRHMWRNNRLRRIYPGWFRAIEATYSMKDGKYHFHSPLRNDFGPQGLLQEQGDMQQVAGCRCGGSSLALAIARSVMWAGRKENSYKPVQELANYMAIKDSGYVAKASLGETGLFPIFPNKCNYVLKDVKKWRK